MAGLASHPNDETLRALLDMAPDAIAIVRGPIVLHMSPTGARLLGWERPSDVVGRSIAEWLSPGEFALATRRIAEVMRTARPNEPQDYRMRSLDGHSLIVEVVSVPVTFDGAPAVLSFWRDVTERRALERQVAESARLASLGRLSAGVAHELNNPLTHLVLTVEAMRRLLGARDDAADVVVRARDKVESIAEDVERMVAIASELRLFASPQPGARRPVDLRQPIEAALRTVRDTHAAAGQVRVGQDYDEVDPVDADPMRVQQVFVNLLTNAFDSLGDASGDRAGGDAVSVELRSASPDAVAVHVRDQGPGIPEDMLERVFEPFFTTKAYGRGAGLGLAISRSIVQAMGGSLEVESAPGQGTTFTVTLPVWRAPADSPELAQGSAGRRLRVLVVDDEPGIGRALASCLEEHDVVVATSADEAEEELARDPAFDVILCDVVMPGRSGVEFHQALATSSPGMARRLVFMTGATLGSDEGRALAALPNPLLAKPFDLTRLQHALETAASLLESKRA